MGRHGDDLGARAAGGVFQRTQHGQHRQTIDAGQLPVQQHHVVGLLAQQRDAGQPVLPGGQLQAGVGQVLLHQVAAGGIVFDQQHPQGGRQRRRGGARGRPRRQLGRRGRPQCHRPQWQRKPEGAALARARRHVDLAAQQLAQVPRNRQPQAGTAEAAGAGPVALAEGVVDVGQHRGVDALAGVGHGDAHAVVGGRDRHRHLAAAGELQRVAQQVDQDLARAQRIAQHPLGHRRVHLHLQLQAAAAGLVLEQAHRLVDHGAQRERRQRHRQVAGLDAAQVQHIADQRGQRAAGRAHLRHQAALAGVQGRHGQQLGHAQHGIQRGAQLMAHHRQELRLGAAGGLGRITGAAQLLLARGHGVQQVVETMAQHGQLVAALHRQGQVGAGALAAHPVHRRHHPRQRLQQQAVHHAVHHRQRQQQHPQASPQRLQQQGIAFGTQRIAREAHHHPGGIAGPAGMDRHHHQPGVAIGRLQCR